MADYYPLLARAVAGLDPNTPETRDGVYARARNALSRQLASVEPPVPQDVIDRELGALQAVVDRIEQEQSAAGELPSEPEAERALEPPVETLTPPVPREPARPQVLRRERSSARKPWMAVFYAVGLVVVAAVAALAYLRRNEPPAVSVRPVAQAPAPAPATPPVKADERVGPSGVEPSTRPAAPAPADPPPQQPAAPAQPAPRPADPPAAAQAPAPATTAVAVANRMMLVLEGKEDPQKVDVRHGTVVWSTETVPGLQGQAPQLAIRGVAEVPEARLRAEIMIQRNRDPAFPASHTVQVQFTTFGSSEVGAIQSLNQIELRQTESQTGYPLAGQGIAVMENVFLIALAQIEPAMSRNVEMLKARPLLYFEFQASGGRRGAMIIEKGVSGQQAFDDAFRSWQ